MDILTRVNWVDVLVLIIVLRTTYVSFKDGLTHELFPLLGSIFMVVASLGYYARLGYFLNQNMISMPIELANFITFVALVVVSGIIFKLLKFAVDYIIRFQWNPALERAGGGVCGVLRAFIAASLVLMILSMMPLPYLQRSIRENSLTGKYILAIGPYVYQKVSTLIPGLVADGNAAGPDELLNELQSDKSLKVNMPGKKPRTAEWEKVTEL